MSRDFSAHMAAARAHVDARWSPERERVVWHAVQRAQRRRRHTKVTAAAVSALLCLFVVGRLFAGGDWGFLSDEAATVRAQAPAGVAPSEAKLLLRLEDGSTVTPAKDKTAEVKPVELGPQLVELRLLNGSARFSVAPQKQRLFRVLAGDVAVTVLGTVFEVSLAPDHVTVIVEKGHVSVTGTETERVLRAGERAVVARARSEPSAGEEDAPGPIGAPDPDPPELDDARRGAAPQRQVRRNPDWRELARSGDYEAAYVHLEQAKYTTVRNTPDDLLLTADVARLSGHAAGAVGPLRQLVNEHSGDPRAPLAAFTLGRVLLDQLGRPREAAQAFARARRLAPAGSLAQDSLAREVESWSRAGDMEQARSGARRYLTAYPDSPRAQAVRRWAQLAD